MSGHNEWLDRNLAERLTFSSFSADPNDARAAEAVSRPYQIVALPGYETPMGLDRSSKDALWLEKAPNGEMVVWDGFNPYALFEIVYECFGFSPGEIDGRICVRRSSTSEVIEDPRSDQALRLRPRRIPSMDRQQYRRHIGDLYAWACAVATDPSDTSTRPGEGKATTMKVYDDLFVYGSRNDTLSTADAVKRDNFLNHRDLPPRAPQRPSCLKSGRSAPVGGSRDDFVLSDSSRTQIRERGMTLADVELLSYPNPGDLVGASMSVHQADTGLAKGAAEDMRRHLDDVLKAREQSGTKPGPAAASPAVKLPRDDVEGDAPHEGWLAKILRNKRHSGSDGF